MPTPQPPPQRTSDAAVHRPTEAVASGLSPVEAAVAHFLSRLSGEELPHLCLRGVDAFPHLEAGSDVDLLLSPEWVPRAVELLEEVCRHEGARVHARHRAGFLTQLYLHGRDDQGRHHLGQVDLHAGEACYGVPFLTLTDLWPGRVTDAHGLPRPSPGARALVHLLGPLLSARVARDATVERLAACLADPHTDARSLAARTFGPALGLRLLRAVEARDLPALRALTGALRAQLVGRAWRRRPLGTPLDALRFLWGTRLRPWVRPRGLSVALIGTDGTGKSTLGDALWAELEPGFRASTNARFKLRPAVLPTLDRLVHLGRRTHTEADFERPHRARPSGPLGSALRAAWYAVDHRLGHWLRVLPRRRQQCLVLFDRYFDDFLVDPLRARISRESRAPEVLEVLVPRPDVLLVCDASLETVRARKQELDEEETARQLEAYRELAAADPQAHVIDTDRPLPEVLDQALCAIFLGRTRP